jgi:TolA-binding protein
MNMVRTVLTVALALVLCVPPALAAPKATANKKPKPSFNIGARKKVKSATDQTEVSIRANIDNQKMILELEDRNDRNFPAMLVALADFYWDLSEIYERKSGSLELDRAIFNAEEAKDTKKLAELRSVQQAHLAKQLEYQEKTVATYRDVIKEFPGAPKIDEIRYFLGYHLYLMGRAHEGVEAYRQVILQHPTSSLVPDALVNIGEYYFSQNDYDNALKLYQKAESYKDSPVHAIAIYKQAWAYFNLGVYDISLSKFLQVIKVAKDQQRKGMDSAFGLEKDAANDMVLPYSKKGKAKAAIAFFKTYATERYLEVCGRLAGLYTEENKFDKSTLLLRMLVKEARSEQGNSNKRYLTVRFQRVIVDNMNRKGEKQGTVDAVKELTRLFLEESQTAPADFVKKESDLVDSLILNIATEYHREWKSTKTKATLAYTQDLYDLYLQIFSDKPNAYDIHFNNALLMIMVGRYEQAITAFENVIAMRPNGKYASDAAEQAVIAHLQNMSVETDEVKNENVEDLAKRELDENESRFVQAVNRWMDIIKVKGTTPENEENVPKARFLAAKIYYNANHFASAADYFVSFVDQHPKHEYAQNAASHVLSCYNLLRDSENLRKYADKYGTYAQFKGTDLSAAIERVKREFNYIKCFKFEEEEQFLGAANCYKAYANEHPDSEKAPIAIFNSAANFFKAKQVEQSMTMQKDLYDRYKKHELAPKALYAIGNIYRKTAVFGEAAYIFEYFVNNHPKHTLAKQALRYASIFRKTLGQYDAAVSNLQRFIKRYPKHKNLALVHIEVMLIRAKQGKPGAVIKEGKRHFKQFKSEGPSTRIRAHWAMGLAFRKLKNERKAQELFRKAVDFFNAIKVEDRSNVTGVALAALAESHFNLGLGVLEKSRNIKLRGNDKKLAKALKKRSQLLSKTQDIYKRVIAYRRPGWQIAAYTQLGGAYSDLADALENAEVPKKFRAVFELEEAFRQKMTDRAEKVRDSALASYREATKIAREKHWFNVYSQQAEEAIARLDLNDKSVKEYRMSPNECGPNRAYSFKERVQ